MYSYITKIAATNTNSSITKIYPDVYEIYSAVMTNNTPVIIDTTVYENETFKAFAKLTIEAAGAALNHPEFSDVSRFVSSDNLVIYSIQTFANVAAGQAWSNTINLSALMSTRIAFGQLAGFNSETKTIDINVLTFEEAETAFNSGTLLNQ